MYNTATLTVSLVALAVSALTAWRQVHQARSTSAFNAVLELYLRDVRDKEYQRDQDYIVRRLAAEHSPERGIAGLPEPVRHAVWNVAFLYESIGMMYALGILDRRIALGVFNYRVRQVWQVLHPFVQQERALRQGPFLAFFEHLCLDAEETPVTDLYREAGLRSRDGFEPPASP